MTLYPKYRELEKIENGRRSAWGVFGSEDDLGTANFLSPAAVTAAAREIRTGERVNLSLPLDLPTPPFFGRTPLRHEIFRHSELVLDDVMDNFFPQASSQWDGLRHRKDPDAGFYNGVSEEEAGAGGSRLGVENWAQQGIVGRGVLLDLPRFGGIDDYDPFVPHRIDVRMINRVLDAERVVLSDGDILLVRTGYMGAYLAAPIGDRGLLRDKVSSAGLDAAEEMAEFLWDNRIAAAAGDNPGLEALPRNPELPDLHSRLIPMLGFVIGEFWALDALAEASARDGRYTCFLTSVPLNLPGGVGTPANAIALR